MSTFVRLSLFPLFLLSLPAVLAAAPPLEISLDRPDAIYKVGDEVTFTLQGDSASDAEISWETSLDGFKVLAKGKTKANGEVKASLDHPGFLRLTAVINKADGTPFTAYAGAAVSPEKIEPSLPVPDDFDAFWAQQKATLAKVPLKPTLTPIEVPENLDSSIESFDVTMPAEIDGAPVSGYFARPKAAAKKSLPALLWVHGAGVRSSILSSALSGAKDGFLSMDINAHGLPNGKSEEFYKQIANTDLKDYRTEGNRSRDTIYFRGMFVRLQRALDFLTAQEEWNGKVLAVVGHSQGGFQALVAGGLDPRVTFIGSGVPAGCDHSGMVADRISGWPKLVELQPDGSPLPSSLEAARYFDGVNFATRYRGEAILSVGFIDRTCPPTSVYAAYNVLSGPKAMINKPDMGHASTDDIRAAFRSALLKHANITPAETLAK